MNKEIKIYLILLFSFLFWGISAQEYNNIDSLELAMIQETDGLKKLNIFIELNSLVLYFDPDEALENANQIIDMANNIDSPESEIMGYLQLGAIFFDKSDYKTSLDNANKANVLSSELNLDSEFAESLLLIARILSVIGETEKSSQLNFQALKIVEELDDRKGMVKAYGQIGNSFFYQENYNKAGEYYLLSLELANKINDLQGISKGLNNVAAVYSQNGEFVNVEFNIRKSIAINKRIGDRILEGINYINLGSLYNTQESYDSAFHYFNKGNAIFQEFHNIPRITSFNSIMSSYYSGIGKIDSSLYYANIALEIAQEHKLKRSIYTAASRLHNIYSSQEDYKNAHKYGMLSFFMKDSLIIENNSIRLSQMELFYELDKDEQKKEAMRQRRDLIYIIVVSSSIFLMILVFVIILSRNKLSKKNQEIEKTHLKLELEFRNRELASNSMNLIRRNEILSSVSDKLIEIQNEAKGKETQLAINQITQELQKITDHNIWDEFKTRFNQVYSCFYTELLKDFPDLTPNEQKLCAFLRLNMSTKEISKLTGQRVNAIEIARTRLRKKLNIAHTKANLVSFLSKF